MKRKGSSQVQQVEGYPVYHLDDVLFQDSTEEEASMKYLPTKRPYYLSLYAGPLNHEKKTCQLVHRHEDT
jgi:hypothetical protein